jgi:HK97 family phage major capsid protein
MTTPEVARTLRAAVAALATGDAATLASSRNLTELVGLSRPQTILGQLSAARRVPLNTTTPAISGDATAYLGSEGVAKPLSKFSLASVSVAPRKITAAIIVSDELLKTANTDAETGLGTELAKALAGQVDRRSIDPNLADSLTAGATTIVATGASLAAVDFDLKALLANFAGKSTAGLVLAMSSGTATYLASLRGSGGSPAFPGIGRNGGVIWTVPVLISDALLSTGSPGVSEIVAIIQIEILISDEGQAAMSVARSASVQLVDNPSDPATSTVSLFQANLLALLVERWLGWARVAATSCAVLTDCPY